MNFRVLRYTLTFSKKYLFILQLNNLSRWSTLSKYSYEFTDVVKRVYNKLLNDRHAITL